MDDKKIPRDSDPGGMTDFEDNATKHTTAPTPASTSAHGDTRDQTNHKADDGPDAGERVNRGV